MVFCSGWTPALQAIVIYIRRVLLHFCHSYLSVAACSPVVVFTPQPKPGATYSWGYKLVSLARDAGYLPLTFIPSFELSDIFAGFKAFGRRAAVAITALILDEVLVSDCKITVLVVSADSDEQYRQELLQ